MRDYTNDASPSSAGCPSRSLRHLHALGGLLGWLAWLASPAYRRTLNANAALAGVAAADRRAAVADAGRLVMELPRLWLRRREQPIADPVRWDNAELLEELLAQGRGLVLLTPHMGSFEVSGAGLCRTLRRPPTHHGAVPPGAPGLAARTGGDRPRPPGAGHGAGQPGGRAPDDAGAAQAARPWACCPTRCRPKAWACGRRSSANRPTR